MENYREPKEKEFSMEIAELDEALKVLDSSLSHIKWRLKSSSRRRLHIDILALCTGMRPVVMVDYGGKMPELQEHLCSLLKLCRKESPTFEQLRVMVIEDMIYLIHIKGIVEHVLSSLNSEAPLFLVDLEQDPPKMVTAAEKSPLWMQLQSIQKLFSSPFTPDEVKSDLLQFDSNHVASQSSEIIDLSSCMQDTDVTLPTLNGWLLGYPIVYTLSKEHIADAVYNLSTKSLHIYKVSICRNLNPDRRSDVEELLSFSVPYELSMGGSNEEWAKQYMDLMQMKWERCKKAWRSLQMEVHGCYPQAIAL